MLSCAMTIVLAVVLGQAGSPAADTTLLKAVPADAEVVLRVRSVEAARGDLSKMLEAMSPSAAEALKPMLDQGIGMFTTQYGEKAAQSPWLAIMKLPKPDAEGMPPYAVLVQTEDYAGVQKSLAGGKDVQPKKQPGGYDTIPGAEDKTIYTYKGSGFVAFSESEDLLKGVVKPSSTLDKTLDAEMQRRLLGGDVGLYINLAAVQSRYGDQIEQARQSLMGMLDQAGGAGNPGMVEAAKAMYGRVFDAFKYGQALALNFDFDPQGLVVAGQATVKPDSPAAKRLGGGHTGTGAGLARLPADYANYFYLNVSPESFQGLQQMGMATVFGQGGKPSPALQKAIDTQREAGVQEVIAASSMSGGLRYISQTTVKDPQKFVQGMTAMMAAMKSGGEQDFIKDAKVESQAQSHKGFALHKATFTYDLDKLAKMQPNTPGGAQAIKAMLGGDTSTTWYGTDGKVVLAVTAKDWNEAQRQIDALLTGQGSLGEAPGYEAARSKLPQNVTAMILISAQGIVRQMSSALNAMMPGANANPPIDMPKEPALLGASITNTPAGYQFNFAMPSAVGKVIEKGLLPLFQGLQGGKVEK